jgi:hypothetical protein
MLPAGSPALEMPSSVRAPSGSFLEVPRRQTDFLLLPDHQLPIPLYLALGVLRN